MKNLIQSISKKRTLLLLIALFTIGQMCKAQSLTAAPTLKGKTNAASSKIAPAPSATDYWVDAHSYYDDNGQFTVSDGARVNYQANIQIDGTKATITHLIDLDNFVLDNTLPITGTYDATAKTITVNTPEYSDGMTADDYTLYGNMKYFGDECYLVLFAGNFSATPNPNGQYPLQTTDKLVFDVSDDLATLTPRSGFGCHAFSKSDNSPVGFLAFYKSSTTITKMPEEASLSVIPETVTFTGPAVTVGAQLQKAITLVNKGKTATAYTASVSGNGLELAAYTNIDAATKQTIYVYLKPQQAGNYTGKIDIIATNGSKATVNVEATISNAPDYSQIVKNGDIVFSLTDNSPYVITDTITGFPVAVSTNVGSSTSSQLNAFVEVPEGKTGIISWKGMSRGSYANGMKIYLNDSVIFENPYAHGMVRFFEDDISNIQVLGSGEHHLMFENTTMTDFQNKGEDKSYLYDFDFRLLDITKYQAVLKSDVADFGNHYFDKLSVLDTLTVALVNAGTEPLTVSNVSAEGVFTGIIPTGSAEYGKELPVTIVYNASGVNSFEGDIVISTSAGDFTVHCKGSNIALPVDYTPIVKSGEFSFNTSSNYPFIVEGNTACNSTSKMQMKGKENLDSWLEASFEIPADKVGVLSWTGLNSSWDPFVFMEEVILTTGTIITIDGSNEKKFMGDGVDASSINYTSEELTFAPGRHTVRFYYKKGDSKPKYNDRIEISNMALDITTGIANPDAGNGQLVSTEIYTVDGQRLPRLQRGINVIKKVFDDGTIKTEKRIMP